MYYTWKRVFCWSGQRLRTILSIAVPNGVESGVFQLVKVALSSVVALFGTYQIAANGIAQSFWSMAALIGVAMGPVFITVIGQCMGAGEITQAEFYFKRLLRITALLAIVWNLIVFALTPLIISVYDIAPQTKRLVVQLVLLHNIFNAVAFPFADPLGCGLRAAGDVRYTIGVSIFTTVGVRLIFSVILAMWMQMGVIGIALAMVLDWTVRGIILYVRFRKGKWKSYSVI